MERDEPFGAALFLTRHLDVLKHTFALDTGYTPREGREHDAIDPYAHPVQWSRRFAGLKVFLTLAAAARMVETYETKRGDCDLR